VSPLQWLRSARRVGTNDCICWNCLRLIVLDVPIDARACWAAMEVQPRQAASCVHTFRQTAQVLSDLQNLFRLIVVRHAITSERTPDWI
jgi:hypothetical protein